MAEPDRAPAPPPAPQYVEIEERAIDWATVVAAAATSGITSYAGAAAANHFGNQPQAPPPPPPEPAPQIILPTSYEKDAGN